MKKLILVFLACFPIILSAQEMSADEKELTTAQKHQEILEMVENRAFALWINRPFDGQIGLADEGADEDYKVDNFLAVKGSIAAMQVFAYNPREEEYFIEGPIWRYEVKDLGPDEGVELRLVVYQVTAKDMLIRFSNRGTGSITFLRDSLWPALGFWLKPMDDTQEYFGKIPLWRRFEQRKGESIHTPRFSKPRPPRLDIN
ncbi:MAG: hypothetical protein AAF242_05320 [Bacteroidota bacterium]